MTAYLDHNAGTPILPVALDATLAHLSGEWGNPSSIHEPGQRSAGILDRTRRDLAATLAVEPETLVFTASGTEAVQTALFGVCRSREAAPGHLVVSAIEHHAVLDAARSLETQGWTVSWALPGPDGVVRVEEIESGLRSDTVLVALLHANNETGVIQPVEAVGRLCRSRGVVFLCDTVQSYGKLPVLAGDIGADLLALAAHKFGGPQGAGVLWRRPGLDLSPLLPGTQERGFRGGTQNVAAIAGMGAAAVWMEAHRDEIAAAARALRDRLEEVVLSRIPSARVTGAGAERLPNTSHLTFAQDPEGASGADLVAALDMAGYAVSSGSACRSGTGEPSHVLEAMGYTSQEARRALRVSLGPSTSERDIDGFVDVLTGLFGRGAGTPEENAS